MTDFRVNAEWVDYAHGPGADDNQPLATELIGQTAIDGTVFLKPEQRDLVEELVSVAELYDGGTDVQDDPRLWWRSYPKNLMRRGRKWLQDNP